MTGAGPTSHSARTRCAPFAVSSQGLPSILTSLHTQAVQRISGMLTAAPLPGTLEVAKANLHRFGFVGLWERWNETLMLLPHYLGWKNEVCLISPIQFVRAKFSLILHSHCAGRHFPGTANGTTEPRRPGRFRLPGAHTWRRKTHSTWRCTRRRPASSRQRRRSAAGPRAASCRC